MIKIEETVKINLDKFVGEELSISAHQDLETPSKKLLLKMSKSAGIKWAKEVEAIDFYFVNRAVNEAMKYVLSFYEGKENPERNAAIEQTELFGFIAGVIEQVNER